MRESIAFDKVNCKQDLDISVGIVFICRLCFYSSFIIESSWDAVVTNGKEVGACLVMPRSTSISFLSISSAIRKFWQMHMNMCGK